MATKREGWRTVQVWDVPTRVFHWLLAALIVGSYLTQELNQLDRHMTIGFIVLTLVLFRMIWGVVGSRPSRFASFAPTPGRLALYTRELVRGRPPTTVGHNPLGAIPIFVMLALVLVQGATGLFASDDIFSEGPLAKLVSEDTSDWLTEIHETNFWILVGVIILHVTANVLYEVLLKQPLIQAMISGSKPVPGEAEAPPLRPVWWAVPALAVAGGIVWYVVTQV